MVETLYIYRESHDRQFEQLGNKIEDLAIQVNHLTVSVDRMSQSVDRLGNTVDRMAASVDRMSQFVDRITQSVDGHLEVARQQAINIAELTKLVATQANTVNRLIDRAVA
ncbi:MAG: hypothetical protein VKJ24_03325 [Synechococcales bacterium]|nr:hypothetical protein [Synechococcales bacterium]